MANVTPAKPLVGALRGRSESAAIDLAPDAVLKAGTVEATQGVLTVKNKELGDLIQSKLASASQLAAAHGAAAADTDVGVSVKVHF
jgi:hypothetical protein